MTDTNHGISLASFYRLPARAFSINNLVDGKRWRKAGDGGGSGDGGGGRELMAGDANGLWP